MKRITPYILLLCTVIHVVYGACTLPTALDGTWWDSRVNAAVSFTQSSGRVNSGWGVTAYLMTPLNTFTCVESDDSYWLFQSDETATLFLVKYYGFFCVKYTKITDNSYSYYLDSDIQTDIQSIRITMRPENEVASGVTISSTCSPSSGPSIEEFHVLVKEGQQANVKQWFPDNILGNYAYEVTDATPTTTCGTGSVWDGCTNRTTVTFNYTQCSTTMFKSTGGELYATQSMTSGSTSYVIIINGDANPVSSNIFTCLAISELSVSSNPGSCVMGQSPTSRTTSSDSILITLTVYELCPFTTASDSSSNIGLIVGLVFLFLIIIAVVVGLFIYFRVYKKKLFPCEKYKIMNGNEENAENAEKPTALTAVEVPESETTTVNQNKKPILNRSRTRFTPETKQPVPRVTPEKKSPSSRKKTPPETDLNRNLPSREKLKI